MSATRSERIIAGIIVLGAMVIAIGSPVWWHDEKRTWPQAKKTGNFWEDVAEPRERRLMPVYSDIVSRDGLALTIQAEDGSRKTYTDDASARKLVCGNDGEPTEDCIAYHLWEVSPDRRFVTLRIGYYEGGSALLLDRATGAELPLGDVPHPSPDKQHWAMVDGSEAYGSGKVSVIGHGAEKPRIIASDTMGTCDFEGWENDSVFLVRCFDYKEGIEVGFRVTWDDGQLIKTRIRDAAL